MIEARNNNEEREDERKEMEVVGSRRRLNEIRRKRGRNKN